MMPAGTRLDLTQRDLGDRAPELHRRALAGCVEARNEIVEANLALAGWFADRHAHRYRPMLMEDVVAAACRGLISAAERFDPARGVLFSTYAQHWMRQAAQVEHYKHAARFGEPRHYYQSREKYLHRHGSDGVLAAHTARVVLPVESPEAWTVAAPGPPVEDILEPPGDAARAEAAGLAWDALTPTEARVIRLKFGLDDGRERTNGEVGKSLGVSKEAVRQVSGRALRRLRHAAAQGGAL